MTKPTTVSPTLGSPAPAVDTPPKRRRLTAEARKSSILEAARRAFIETGDMNGTTIKVIAERSGISEGVIYRHFESKDQLFLEAVVEPLKQAVDDLVAATEGVDRDQPLTPERQFETMTGLYRQLVSTLERILPLLGLVLFGDPKVARKFYRENFAAAMDRLAEAWREVEDRYGFPFESPDISARAVLRHGAHPGAGEPPREEVQPHPRGEPDQRGHRQGLLPRHRHRVVKHRHLKHRVVKHRVVKHRVVKHRVVALRRGRLTSSTPPQQSGRLLS